MGLNSTFDGNWQNYWDTYDDVKMLKKWSSDMDQLLQKLEKTLEIKLLARDHFEIIEALENRIEVLDQPKKDTPTTDEVGIQGELFAAQKINID